MSPPPGEQVAILERMIVAPGAGIFRPRPDDRPAAGARLVCEGEPIGDLVGPGTEVPVRSPFRGHLMGMLAHPGERLRPGQPVAWLRVT